MTEDTQSLRILIVEDDEDQRDLLVETLALHYGDEKMVGITAVGTGAEALSLDLTQFDLVLQDFHLPDTTGLELIVEIRKRADVPVIFVTGENDSVSAASAIQRGAQDYVLKFGDYLFAIPIVVDKNLRQWALRKEFVRLQKRLQETVEELRVKNLQLEESLGRVETMATTDHLTGVANRRRFAELLEKQFDQACRYGHDLACCMCDLDNYKKVNDTHGHQAGDEVLRLTADTIRSALRSPDVVARYGGDEFVMLLPHTAASAAASVCRRIRGQLQGLFEPYQSGPRRLDISVGIASLVDDCPSSAEQLVLLADRALLASKDRGKGQVLQLGHAR